ncbi:beta-1,6-glucan synthase [Blastochloris sulfoviridis]|uniref:Endo-1,3-beta-glucanase btgC n=1 Tax=Blastochloris sulfoviridis TaxID=50712 RepID=A0A5M6HWV6_9HYPH|nr:beta-1,6-glucan synthase [Blastochloris sulfoviridis]KAA5600393.1 beta-1,6-glucan synthase [Blastochloris sulfoviridis]
MLRAISTLGLAVVVVVSAWAWLGVPVAMPPSPLSAGEKLHCVSYAPFRNGQSPLDGGTVIPRAQIEEDLARLAKVTDCVRTYATELGLSMVPEIAAQHGLKVLQGLWLGSDPEKNAVEIETVVRLANEHRDTIRGVVVGNEVLLRGEMSDIDLADTIRKVKAQVPVPVTYADVWEYWLRHRNLALAVDFVTIHILPYWEDFPVAAHDAGRHIDEIERKVAAVFPGKEILIGEAGWPSTGRMREGALPSPANQARVIHDLLELAKRDGYRVNVIEAFDQPWKRRLEGTVGGHWGLLDASSRAPKFVLGEAVSNRPLWIWQAIGGVLMVLAVGASAHLAAHRRGAVIQVSWGGWAALWLLAVSAGVFVPMAAEAAMLESLGPGGWVRNGALLAAAAAAAPLIAAALVFGRPLEGFGVVLDSQQRLMTDLWIKAPALLLIIVTVLAIQSALGLVFDARYKDFPFAALSAAVLPLAVLAVSGPRGPRLEGIAEFAAAAVLVGSAIFVSLNETFANWQAQWTCVLWLVLAATLLRARGARS